MHAPMISIEITPQNEIISFIVSATTLLTKCLSPAFIKDLNTNNLRKCVMTIIIAVFHFCIYGLLFGITYLPTSIRSNYLIIKTNKELQLL